MKLFNLLAVAGAFVPAYFLAPYTDPFSILLGLFFNGVAVCWLASDVKSLEKSHD